MTRGSPYKFAIMNSSEISHLGKTLISPNWWNQFWWNLWCWNKDWRGYLSTKFYTYRSISFGYTAETVSDISVEEIGKLGLPALGASLHFFQKRSTLESSNWRDIYLYPVRSKRFQFFKIRASLTNPISSSAGTKMDTSNR